MTQSTTQSTTQIDPFTQNLLHSLATTTAWAALHPRDPMEQMLASQIVGAHNAALDCLSKASEAEDPALSDKLWRTHATLTRTMRETMRLLSKHQQQPADTAPLPVIETIPPPRRRPPEAKPTKHPIHREEPRAPMKDPAKMTDAEIEENKERILTDSANALFRPHHPRHREALAFLPMILPGIIIPDSYLQDPVPEAA